MKECAKCGHIKHLDEFRDPSLVRGYGRICNKCKEQTKRSRAAVTLKPSEQVTEGAQVEV